MLREFKPTRNQREDIKPQEISALFERGEFKKALAHCRTMGYSLDEFSEALTRMATKMLRSRPGELLALIYKHKIDIGYDVSVILRAQLRIRDYHGFLKNVYRFKVHAEFEPEVETAISNITRAEEAEAWRIKFARLPGNK